MPGKKKKVVRKSKGGAPAPMNNSMIGDIGKEIFKSTPIVGPIMRVTKLPSTLLNFIPGIGPELAAVARFLGYGKKKRKRGGAALHQARSVLGGSNLAF